MINRYLHTCDEHAIVIISMTILEPVTTFEMINAYAHSFCGELRTHGQILLDV